jgi:CopA family copper-resistance protein
VSFHRRDLLKFMLFSGLAYSLPGFSALRRLEVADFKEKEGLLEYTLIIRKEPVEVGKRRGTGVLVNGLLPSPLLRFKEGKEVVINVINEMEEETSIHWHGLYVPNNMDGVPGVVFPGIPPKGRFTYRFPVVQSGTYWYHSHSLMQEQLGLYGPLILEPKDGDPIKADRDYVIVLSDWTDEDPHRILSKLKKYPGYYNFQKRTLGDFIREVREKGFSQTLRERLMWAQMRMDSRDIADITGYTYTYLMNGQTTQENPTFIFKPGEKIRLRFINASSATYFNVQIPGLKMTIVQADGQNVYPVDVDEFRIAIAETYDVIVEVVRFAIINHTMIHHPIHLHGMWMYLDNGGDALNPRKHTIDVKPGEVVFVNVKADKPGLWAFHCHVLYHMDTGMFRVVRVR